MRGETAVIIAFLCMLQCNLYQAKNGKSNNQCVMRIPYQAISNPPQSQKQYLPYPFYSLFNNSCNGRQSSICNRRCITSKNNKVLYLKLYSPFLLSIPGPNGERIKMFIKDQKKRPEGELKVEVVMRLNDTKPGANTAAKDSANESQGKEVLSADTSAGGWVMQVMDNYTGEMLKDDDLTVKMIEENPPSGKPAPTNSSSPPKDSPPKYPPPSEPSPPDNGYPPADNSKPKKPTDSDAPNDEVEVPASPPADNPEKPADSYPTSVPKGDKPDNDKDSDDASTAGAAAEAEASAVDGVAAAASSSSSAAAT